jgi:hypothetical protein
MIAVESGPYYAFINYIHIDNRVETESLEGNNYWFIVI